LTHGGKGDNERGEAGENRTLFGKKGGAPQQMAQWKITKKA